MEYLRFHFYNAIFDVITFMIAFSCMVALVKTGNLQVKVVNRLVQEKSTIVSLNDENHEDKLKISGKNVYSDIINMDESVNVYINSTLLNTEVMPNGKNFLEYVRNSDNTVLAPYILFEHEYKKTVLIDTTGKVVGIRFSL